MDSASPAPVIVYSTTWCGQCRTAKSLLTRRGIAFEEVDAEARWGNAFRDELFRLCGQFTVPQIVVGTTPIGGLADLLRLDEAGELRRLVAAGSP